MKTILFLSLFGSIVAHAKGSKFLDAYLFCEKGDQSCITIDQDRDEPVRVQMKTKIKLKVDSASVGSTHLDLKLENRTKEQLGKLTQENIGKRLVIAYGRAVALVQVIKTPIENGAGLLISVENILDHKESETPMSFCKKITTICTKAVK